MTVCAKYEDRLEALHDGELAGLRRWRVSRHVGACAHCAAHLEALRRLGTALREQESEGPVPDLWAGIAARLGEVDRRLAAGETPATPEALPAASSRWPRRFWPLPIGVGGLAAAVVAVVLFTQSPSLAVDDTVEEVDAMGRPVAVLPGDEKSTIIWVLDPTPVARSEEDTREVL